MKVDQNILGEELSLKPTWDRYGKCEQVELEAFHRGDVLLAELSSISQASQLSVRKIFHANIICRRNNDSIYI